MRIAITGATGMIGSKLTAYFLAERHEVTVITRRSSYHQPQTTAIVWDLALEYIDIEKLEGVDVVINLAGTSIAEYWSPAYKKSILDSRISSTKLLCTHLAKLVSKPKLLMSASAIGYYGPYPSDEVLDETSPAGIGFLADVCRQWEAATLPATQAGIRVVHLRLGVVLSRWGGALDKMRVPFQWGLGGRLGSGLQMMSWVSLEEIPRVVEHLIKNDKIKGAVNVTTPQAVSNAAFTKVLAQQMQRPAFLPVPSLAIRLMLGEMGENLLLEGANVVPRCLQQSGYEFRYADLKAVLKEAIG